MKKTEQLSRLNSGFLGKMAEDLSQIIEAQTKVIFDDLGILVPVKSCSCILAIEELKHASLADIAKELRQSHQLIKQKLPKLEKVLLITKQEDPIDKRRTLYKLTKNGTAQAMAIKKYLQKAQVLTETINKDIGIDIFSSIAEAISLLEQKTLYERYKEL